MREPAAASGRSGVGEQGIHEFAGLEGSKIFGFLANADEADRQRQLLRNREHHAALGGAIEFGQRDAGDIDRFVKAAGLVQGVLPGRGIKYQQSLMGECRVQLLENAGNLLQFLHQIVLGMQTPRRVSDQHIGTPGLGGLVGVEDD